MWLCDATLLPCIIHFFFLHSLRQTHRITKSCHQMISFTCCVQCVCVWPHNILFIFDSKECIFLLTIDTDFPFRVKCFTSPLSGLFFSYLCICFFFFCFFHGTHNALTMSQGWRRALRPRWLKWDLRLHPLSSADSEILHCGRLSYHHRAFISSPSNPP